MLLIPLMIAGSVFLILLALPGLFTRSKTQMEKRIATMVLEEGPSDPAPQQVSLSERMYAILNKTSTLFAGRGYTEKLQIELISAGINFKGEEFISIWVGVTLILPLLCYLLFFNLSLALIALIIGLLAPRFYIKMAREKRIKLLTRQLGYALEVRPTSRRAGFGVDR